MKALRCGYAAKGFLLLLGKDKLKFIEFLKHLHRDSFAAPFDGMDYLKAVCFQPLYLPIKIVKRSNG